MRITIGTQEQDACVMTAFNEIVGTRTVEQPAHLKTAVSKK
jgi:hypothetical protein